ncbi:MAG: DUF177 domain-containing protein [Croceibacterium sp.]
MAIEAEEAEREALARRFGLVGIGRLVADVALDRNGETVDARGRFAADVIQSCAVSAEDFAVAIAGPVAFRFVPARPDHAPGVEIDLAAEDYDEIEYTGTVVDLGEAVAQSLALAIDPFATGPAADAARRSAGLGEGREGPFAALAGLKKG